MGLLLLAACGGGSDRTKAQIRLVNASQAYTQLDFRFDNELRQSQVGYGATDGYVDVDPGKTASISSSGSAGFLRSFVPSLSAKKHYTVLAFGAAGDLRQQVLDEDVGAPDNNRSLLRVVNAAADAGTLDVYLLGSTESLTTAVPVQEDAGYATLGSWITLNSGTWGVKVTLANSKTDIRLELPALALASKQVVTLVLTPSEGGVMVHALVLTQQSPVLRQDARHARVRLAALVGDSASVAASVGGVTLAAGVASPVVGEYQLVPVGLSAVTTAANAQSLAAASVTLAAGRDYTLMVHGASAGPRVGWLDDDNRLPADLTRAKLRLVSARAVNSAALAMSLDALPLTTTVVPVGSASLPFEATPTTGVGNSNGVLSVTASGATAPLFSATGQVFEASRVYSVFVFEPQAQGQSIVRRDR